ncbi:Mediator of RNA polymerase II transcription subunit 4 [Trichoplax sp. H2]|nr:Mediator of RNA polymerase II transcription subunit 4 [Trichoplax sp. H2]|eukprot:RDD43663.1 Mediator of RNA polymerase II transcription subunit 4 [Trichoplax sp. H2]
MADNPLLSILDQIENLTRETLRKVNVNIRDTSNASKEIDFIANKDEEFRKALVDAQGKIEVYNKIRKCNEAVVQQDRVIVQLMDKLKQAESSLMSAIENAKEVLPCEESRSVNSEDLIKYAYEISSNHAVCAPTNWQQGDSRRPYPIDIEMRAGILGKLTEYNVNGDNAIDVDYGTSNSNKNSEAVDDSNKQNENLSDQPSESDNEVENLENDQGINNNIGMMSTDSSSDS